MDTNRRQRGVVTVRFPTTERGEARFIEKVRKALEEGKRVRLKRAEETGGVSGDVVDQDTILARQLLLELDVDFNTPGVYWVDVSNPEKYDQEGWYAAIQRGNRILNVDGRDLIECILATERQRHEQSIVDQMTEEFISMMRRLSCRHGSNHGPVVVSCNRETRTADATKASTCSASQG